MPALFDTIVFDIGGTLVVESDPATPTDRLDVVLRPRVVEDLSELADAGYRLAAATNTATMGEDEVRALLSPSGVSRLLEVLATSAQVGVDKPNPAVLLAVLERLGVTDPARALYVGDRDIDEAAAVAAGMAFAPVGAGTVRAAVDGWTEANAGSRFAAAAATVHPPDRQAAAAAAELQDRLTKPRGSLGRLESIGIQLAGLAGVNPPPVPTPATVTIFAGDHGVLAEGVSPWPQEVTAQMVANFATGGAAINVLARHSGVGVVVVDVGVATPLLAAEGVVQRRVRPGTANLAAGPAMTVVEARQALDVGTEFAEAAVGRGARCLITGDMGIANTTPSAALIAAVTGRRPAEVTGRGTGIDDATLALKIEVIETALSRLAADADPLTVLAEVGGLEIAALAGYIVAGAAAGVPVVVDGVVATAALVVAEALVPGTSAWCVAGHRSVEPGASAALAHLRMEPVLDLGLRLGEGTGALLALPIVQAAAKILGEMATFDSAGVANKQA